MCRAASCTARQAAAIRSRWSTGRPPATRYFYDRFAKFIPLDVKASTGDSVRLRESGGDGLDAQFVLQRVADGTFRGTWTQAHTGKRLAVVLR
jgi:hypothetical protein